MIHGYHHALQPILDSSHSLLFLKLFVSQMIKEVISIVRIVLLVFFVLSFHFYPDYLKCSFRQIIEGTSIRGIYLKEVQVELYLAIKDVGHYIEMGRLGRN